MNAFQSFRATGLWVWILSTLIVCLSHSSSRNETVRVIPGPVSMLTAAQPHWVVPLSRVPGIDAISEWPFLLFAIVAAAELTWFGRGQSGEYSVERLLAIVGMSAWIAPRDLVPVALLALMARREQTASRWMALLPIGLGLLSTLEFGVLIGVAMALGFEAPWAGPYRSHARRITTVCLGGGLAIGFVLWQFPGFSACLGRPLNWIWLRPSSDLLPDLMSTIRSPHCWGPLIGVAPLIYRQAAHFLNSPAIGPRTVMFLVCLLLALTCRFYAVQGFIGAMAMLRGQPEPGTSLSSWRWIVWLSVGVASVSWGITQGPAVSLLGEQRSHSLVPTRWGTSGPVVLLNLEDVPAWQVSRVSAQFSLLADDRWDVLGGKTYRAYSQLCRDLREVRDFSYLRSDGQWGGYKVWLEKWHPTLVVSRSDDAEAIRGLSLSPDWRVMGIDSRQVIFGIALDPRNQLQQRKAIQCLMTLEWPAQLDQYDPENTIVSETLDADPALARGLCSLRFPYAGLRYLRDRNDPEVNRLKARCYLDLAHRVAGQSRSGSLLDQFRAIEAVRRVAGSTPPAERPGLERGLASLLSPGDLHTEGFAPDSLEIRQALLTGNPTTAAEALNRLPPPIRGYYQALFDSPGKSAVEVQQSLQTAIDSLPPNTPPTVRSEAMFYLGCAALEAGDTFAAASALHASEQLDSHLPFREIRSLYLRQLTR